jgi:RNA polymerase sigma factor (sigma-70 family)
MPPYENEVSPADHAEIFACYGPVIFAYLRLHASSREEAEDLTLDVFTAALTNQQLITWSGPRQLGWLKRVATNKLVDSYRRINRRPLVPLDQMTETLLNEHDPERITLRNEDYAQLYQQIKRLSPLQQEILHLRYGNGLHTAEIAALLNKSEQAIRQILSRTIGLLRTMYDIQPSRKGGEV